MENNKSLACNVGVIGIGVMGLAISNRLHLRGFKVFIFDKEVSVIGRDNDLSTLVVLDSAEAVGRAASIILVVVTNDDDVEEVINGQQGLCLSLRAGDTLIIHSTVRPSTISKLASNFSSIGVEIVDAAMSGGEHSAKAGNLTLFIGGTEEKLQNRLGRVLSAYSSSFFWFDSKGAGMTVKLINNLLLHSNRLALYESFFFSQAIGLDFHKIRDAIRVGTGRSWVADNWGDLDLEIVTNGLPGSTFLGQLQKDLGLFLELCTDNNFYCPVGALVRKLLPGVVAGGGWPETGTD